MVNTFFGLDLKTGAKVIIFTTLIENFIFYVLSLALMLKSKEDESQYDGVLLYLEELENHVIWVTNSKISNFSAIFALVGGFISVLLLIFNKLKTWKILWLIHSGITIELFTLLLTKLLLSHKYSVTFITGIIPAFVYLCIKIYSWIAMASFFRQQNSEERKDKFRSQWITNSILASPNIRLTLPEPASI